MKRVLFSALFLFALGSGLRAQVVDTTVCAVVKNPKSFDGKIVRIKGTVAVNFDQFILKDDVCGFQVDSIWLDYPPGTKGKAGPLALVTLQPAHNFTGTYTPPTRTPVTLDKTKDFKQFDSLLAQQHNKGTGMCLGCARYEVSATLVGRLDAVADATVKRDSAGKIIGFGGFGNMNAYPARLVLESVTDVTPKEIDYSKADAAAKGDLAPIEAPGQLGNPIEAAQKSVATMGSGALADAAKKDAAVYPKPHEQNGVVVSFGTSNEASPKDEAADPKDSPDGVLYNCTFNMDKMEGDAKIRALFHIGQHVSDLRTPPPPGEPEVPPYVLEHNGWIISVASAVSNGTKFFTLPGGFLAYSANWPPADRTNMIGDALNDFLSKEAYLSK